MPKYASGNWFLSFHRQKRAGFGHSYRVLRPKSARLNGFNWPEYFTFASIQPLSFNYTLTQMPRLKLTHAQSCAYCYQDFIPNKRGTQRFCSASCRTTHCRKKSAGTLGRVTRLPGPAKAHIGGSSFAETTLASATGALAANAVSQTAEYFVVTKGLVQQVEQLTSLVQQLITAQMNTTKLVGRGTLNVLTRLGASKEEALEAINTPFLPPAPVEKAPVSATASSPTPPAPALPLAGQPQVAPSTRNLSSGRVEASKATRRMRFNPDTVKAASTDPSTLGTSTEV